MSLFSFQKNESRLPDPLLVRTPTAIVDQEDRVITVLAGRPQGPDWDAVHKGMSDVLEDLPVNIQGRRKERRGSFVSLSTGISYGGGQTVRTCQHAVLTSY